MINETPAHDARAEILRRIKLALRDRPETAPAPRQYRTADEPDPRTDADLVDLLGERLADYQAAVRRCSETALPEIVAAALLARQPRHIVVPSDLDPTWVSALRSVLVTVDDPSLRPEDLDGIDGVVTTCAIAIAETGTIVLDGGPGQGRRAISLVPDYHLVVVPSEKVVGSVPSAITRLDPTRPLTWISGPSATSDIELSRVEGVHGPRTLDVVLVT